MSQLKPHTPFVGRRHELATLTGRLEAARRGQGGIILVGGEPGIGKTRLVLEVAERARAKGWTVLVEHAYESEGTPPYALFTSAVREYLASCTSGEVGTQLRDRAARVGLVASKTRQRPPSQPPGHSISPELARHRLFEGVSDIIAAIAHAASPGLLLILDDLQWADRPSLLLLQHLARRLAGLPILVAGTYRTVELSRSDPLAAVLASLRRENTAERLLLQALSREETASLARGISGCHLAEDATEALYVSTGGHPFFLEELVRHLLAEGRDLSDPGVAANAWIVPDGVREVINARLSRLSMNANRLLKVAAILGDGYGFDPLADLVDVSPSKLLDALDEVLAAGILREEEGIYRFSHALIRQTIEEQLSLPRRQRLHRAAAETIEKLYERDPEQHLHSIAEHYRQAGRGAEDKIFEYARRAGDAAAVVYAWEKAADCWETALEMVSEDDRKSRCELLLAIGEARNRAGMPASAKEYFRQVAEIARATGMPELFAHAALGYAGEWAPRLDADQHLVPLLEEALTLLGEEDSALRVSVLARLATGLRLSTWKERRAALSWEAVKSARRVGEQVALADALIARRIALWDPVHLNERLALAAEAVAVAHAAGDRERVLRGSQYRLVDLLELGDLEAVDRELEAYEQTAGSLRLPQPKIRLVQWQAMRAHLEGRFDEAGRLAQQALTAARAVQSPEVTAQYRLQMLVFGRDRGTIAEQELASIRSTHERSPAFRFLRSQLAVFYCDLARETEAREELDRFDLHHTGGLGSGSTALGVLANLATVCASIGDRRRAAVLYERLLPYAEHLIPLDVGIACLGAAAHYLGLLAATLGLQSKAETHYASAAATHARLNMRPALARTELAFARALFDSNEQNAKDESLKRLSHAFEIAAGLHMPGLLHEISQLGGPLRLDPRKEARADRNESQVATAYTWKSLTAREIQVLRSLATGKTNKEIAAELILSPRTVQQHTVNIYAKLGARGRSEAAAFAVRQGIASTVSFASPSPR